MSEGVSGGRAGPGTHILRGSFWMVALRWAIRLTGLVSTLVLARVLTPKDFGVVAMAMIVVGMLEILSLTGQNAAIIRHQDPTRDHYDTAWTISVMTGFVIAAAIVLVAPFTNVYFHDEQAILVMQCLALRAVLAGFQNVGTLDFQRELQFDRVFSYNLYAKLISFFVTIGLAFWLRNYWALVAGILCGQLSRTVLSFVVHPYRPRFSLAGISEIWSFSAWSFIRALGGYFQSQVDVIAVGGATGATSMGRYTVAKDVASSPTDEILYPMTSVLFPVMARYQHDTAQLRHLYLRMQGWVLMIGTSTGLGIWMVAPDMVRLVLGPKWIDITPLIGWIALTASIQGLSNSAYAMLDVLNLPHIGARLQWLRGIPMALVLIPIAYLTHDLVDLVMARFVMTAILMLPLLGVVGIRISVAPRDYATASWRPFAAGGLMVLAVWALNETLAVQGSVRLGLDIVLGVVTYVGSLMALWSFSGRPPSAERDVIGLIERGQDMLLTIRARVLRTAP